MAGNQTLAQRMKAEFDASSGRARATEQEKARQHQEYEARLAQFNKVCDDLKAVWGPRLEEFVKQFGDNAKATPSMSPSLREAKVDFLTELANVTVTLTVSPSADMNKLVLDYELLILPMFFDYQRHAKLEMPMDRIDKNAVGQWLDDNLVSCVKTYLSLNENEYYLKRALVEDPISKKRLLPDHASARLEHQGKTFYFESKDTLEKFRAQIGQTPSSAGSKPVAPPDPAKPAAAPAVARTNR